MPPPMDQVEARKIISYTLEQDKATLVSPKEGDIKADTPIAYLCGKCAKQHSKTFINLKTGTGSGLCKLCAQKRGNERRIASLAALPKMNINRGETDFNRDLAEKTALKNGSTLLGIFLKEGEDYTEIENDNRINRSCYLHILCPCGEKDYVYFRNAYGCGAKKPGEGLCLCAACRKGHHSASLRKFRRGDDTTSEIVIESMPKRAERIERDGQECTDCKQHKTVSNFFGLFNSIENCKVYEGRCYACSRKLRTSNREDALRNGSIEDFMKKELANARDRNKKFNRKNPDQAREFNITVPFLMELFERQDRKCALSGLPMLTTTHRDQCPEDKRCSPDKLSIDRIDSLRGYTQDNVQLLRWRSNCMKNDLTSAEHREEIRAQYEHLFGSRVEAT